MGFCFLENHDLKEALVFRSAFLAGAFVFWQNHDLEETMVFGSAFLAGAFVFWENHDLWGPILGPFGVCLGSMLRPDGDSGLRPSQDQIFGPLGASLGPHVGPMLAPRWPHVGSSWAPSWWALGAMLTLSCGDFDQHGR